MKTLSSLLIIAAMGLTSIYQAYAQDLTPFRKGDEWGYVKGTENIVIDMDYDDAYPFDQNGLGMVRSGDQWGFINLAGEEVIDIKYDQVFPYSEGYYLARRGNDYYFLDQTGQVAIDLDDKDYAYARPFVNGRAAVNRDGELKELGDGQVKIVGGQWGYINRSGDEVVICQFEEVRDYYNEHAIVWNNRVDPEGRLYNLIDDRGNFLIMNKYHEMYILDNNLVLVRLKELWGVVNFQGEVVVPIEYENMSRHSVVYDERLKREVPALYKEEDWYYFKPLENKMMKSRYDYMTCFYKGHALVAKDVEAIRDQSYGNQIGKGQWGLINEEMQTLIGIEYSYMSLPSEGAVCVNMNGYINVNGDLIGGYWGFLDMEGQPIIDFKYEGARYFVNGFAAVKRNGKWAFVDSKGKELMIPRYDWVEDFDANGLARVSYNGKHGYVDKTGNEFFIED